MTERGEAQVSRYRRWDELPELLARIRGGADAASPAEAGAEIVIA